jgi:prephenate dehydrogenase
MAERTSLADGTIAVVGVGLIGGSLALGLKRAGVSAKIVGVSSAATVETALDVGAIDAGLTYDDLESALSTADCAFLCTPIERILELMPRALAAMCPDTVLSDVGSTKRAIVSRAEACSSEGVHFIGGHPMAGSEHRGVAAADPFLFQNAIYVMTPASGVSDSVVDSFNSLIRRLGARTVRMDPETHDRVAAAVSHLPQMMATALVEMVGRLNGEDGHHLRMAAGGFRDLTRIASSPYDMWGDICRTNAGPIREMIDGYIDSLQVLRDEVDSEDLAAHFEFANQTRDSIPKDSKGFLHQLHEVLLLVEDRPGVLAGVTALLAESDININDIEVLKVREGEGGTIRMGFDTREIAQQAIETLTKGGYKVRMR